MNDSIASHVPADADRTWETLHPRARWGMRARALLLALPTYLVAGSVLLAAWDGAGVSLGAKAALYAAGFVVIVALAWRLAGVRWSRTRFALDEAGLHIRRGLWWRSETLVPRSRVQHIDLNRGPLDRRFGVTTLRVHTAGTRLASVNLDGLPHARAQQLRDALVVQADDGL